LLRRACVQTCGRRNINRYSTAHTTIKWPKSPRESDEDNFSGPPACLLTRGKQLHVFLRFQKTPNFRPGRWKLRSTSLIERYRWSVMEWISWITNNADERVLPNNFETELSSYLINLRQIQSSHQRLLGICVEYSHHHDMYLHRPTRWQKRKGNNKRRGGKAINHNRWKITKTASLRRNRAWLTFQNFKVYFEARAAEANRSRHWPLSWQAV